MKKSLSFTTKICNKENRNEEQGRTQKKNKTEVPRRKKKKKKSKLVEKQK